MMRGAKKYRVAWNRFPTAQVASIRSSVIQDYPKFDDIESLVRACISTAHRIIPDSVVRLTASGIYNSAQRFINTCINESIRDVKGMGGTLFRETNVKSFIYIYTRIYFIPLYPIVTKLGCPDSCETLPDRTTKAIVETRLSLSFLRR